MELVAVDAILLYHDCYSFDDESFGSSSFHCIVPLLLVVVEEATTAALHHDHGFCLDDDGDGPDFSLECFLPLAAAEADEDRAKPNENDEQSDGDDENEKLVPRPPLVLAAAALPLPHDDDAFVYACAPLVLLDLEFDFCVMKNDERNEQSGHAEKKNQKEFVAVDRRLRDRCGIRGNRISIGILLFRGNAMSALASIPVATLKGRLLFIATTSTS